MTNPFQPPYPHKEKEKFQFGNLHGGSLSLTLSSLSASIEKPLLIITKDSLTAAHLIEEIPFFYPDIEIIHFPDWETLPFDQFSPHQDIISERLSALYYMRNLKRGIVITTMPTLMHRIIPREFLEGNIFLLNVGDKLDRDETCHHLTKAGYIRTHEVREPGEFAVRGAILDLFPTGSQTPFRLDLLDDEIDSIRTFSPETQLSLDKVDRIALLPAKEFPLNEKSIETFRENFRKTFTGNPLNSPIYQDISEGIATPGIEYYLPLFFEKMDTLLNYIPKNSLIIRIENIYNSATDFWREIETRYEARAYDITRPLLKPERVFTPINEIFSELKTYAGIECFVESVNVHTHHYNFDVLKLPTFPVNYQATKPLQALLDFTQSFEGRILFAAETAGRREVLLTLFQTISLFPKVYGDWQEFLNDDAHFGMAIAPLDQGLQLKNPAIALISESELFGKRVMQRRRRKETSQDLQAIVKDLTELQIGSPVVHIDHGVGRYLGLQTLNVGEQMTEFLHLEYADGDKLYVPVTSLHLISRYSGQDPEHAPLHRLGTQNWQRAKRKAEEDLRDVAAELLDLYAKRAAQKGFAFKEQDGQYAAFAASFPFEETPDQQQAILAILKDMADEKPMDRLICGDVGFGKTEVAMRAAFIAVQNNKQVAVLVPTTLLAEQHWQTFKDRFADWPIQIEMISRFKTAKEQKKVIENLEQGKIDIVIGTHKLLQTDIQFKSLGLLIIDEEHRFGVHQKERLKTLRYNVDILALTATPIPRTLNMAFAGIRDLSLIATPPKQRLSVKTFVHEYDTTLVKEALSREIMRGGQVYYLHNDVATIEKAAREIEKIMPEARVVIAHGQMHERELEQVMGDFYHRRFNVLVCTTIIESGIDIPSANTIIIHRADKFGLAQLHQLRGRVGRSHHQAYAYLFIPSRKNLTPDAEKRLDAISTYKDLGIGFTLATHDLEIRGAGELLGKSQSGNMQEIGFTLYMDLLSRSVEALKSGKEPTFEKNITHGPEVELQIPALIPENYLGDIHLRLQFYKRINNAKTERDLDDIQVAMIDRFGLFPLPLKNIFAIQVLKQKATLLGITKIEANSKSGKIEFNEKPNVDPLKIIQLIQKESQQFKLDGPQRLRFTLPPHEVEDRLVLIENILKKLE
jgi:transcription-repair coupling factor (superfamily II helicase)